MNKLEAYQLFTVIITQKNKVKDLMHTLRILIIQDYVKFESIVSDECNQDKSIKLVQNLTNKNARIKLFTDDYHMSMRDKFELASQQYSPLITLMTADYFLTAQDLPGWPGKFAPISYEALIRASFKFIEKSPIENEILVRELNIIKEIAKQHDLLNLFKKLMVTTKRKVVREELFYGFVITNSIRFDGTELEINNIFDASLATNFVYNFYNKISIKEIINFFGNTFRILIREKKYKVENLTNIN